MFSLCHAKPSVASGLEAGDILIGASSRYTILKVLGEGSYGKVLECWSVNSQEKVAIKIMKRRIKDDAERELSMLEAVSMVDADQNNLVKFLEGFEHMGYTCLVFEKLDIDLFELMVQQNSSMCLIDICNTAEQLLVALDALKSLDLIHGDIKPDNVMLVSAEEWPMKAKLVDFGLGVPASQIRPGMMLQTVGFRAPEVSLGLQYNEEVDVWGVGCVLAFLYLCGYLFPIASEYQTMRCIVQTVGQPPDHVLSQGAYTRRFFTEEEDDDVDGSRWRLMTPEEFSQVNGESAGEENPCFELTRGLDELMELYPVMDETEWEERSELVDLLKGLLDVDPDERLTAQEALTHPFFTRCFLSEDQHSHNPVNQEPLDQEPLHQEPQDQEPWDQEPLDKDPLNQEPWDQEPLQQEPWDQEPLNQEPWDQESWDQEPWDQESWDQEPLNEESWDQESWYQEPWDQEPLNQEYWDQEPLNQESWDQESWDQKFWYQEPWDQEPLNQEYWDQEPLNEESWDQESWYQESWDQKFWYQEPWDQEPLNQEYWDQEPLNEESWDQESWDQKFWYQEPWDQEPLNQESWDQECLVFAPKLRNDSCLTTFWK